MNGNSREKKITTKQARGLAALLDQPTLGRAAAAAGVGEATLHRWLKQPGFQQALARAEAEAISEAARSMAAGAREAAHYLRQVLQDDEVSSSEKIRAALGLLNAMPPLRILGSLEQQLQEIKENFSYDRTQ